ncbi:LTA synthase family protein [Rhizobium leucaenae]|uniref:Phosphoglycerol transferase MdoB-like AlkP superfamily enzyme n=1 Tax=Rhizobium leucaenae TaxID=29450 RepID=A0A7W6ZX57_9HYPH|nr:LTA synthase family protein [Rhizobium leucaenae]MBB4569788.1 phosphoglycerol transferase MdoB-like AlkP superfamily enzyme [Rhizobium leucaenae]MBB6299699.1 phosphoglycerol transferase MdoB-like AlkP superfamily enzyme [Rhizobium leucaenae]
MVALVPSFVLAGRFATLQKLRAASRQQTALRELLSLILTFLLALLTVIAVEWVTRGELTDLPNYFMSPIHPGFTTVGIVMLLMLVLDAMFGRAHQSILLVAPLVLIPAFISNQKQHYLSDPLYPSDFLFAHQILGLMPVIVRERPWTAVAVAVGIVASTLALAFLWRYTWRHAAALSRNARITRLSICLPLMVVFASQMDPTQNSLIREKLRIIPIVWDQKENYGYNGFIIAFSLNLPMADVKAPVGYGQNAIDAIPARNYGYLSGPREKPDIIMLMSESFWDPNRLSNLTFTPDPMPNIREAQSGYVFSPEFGGMTANVEFEALTGFSNAFLPYGSIPYQQYVRRPMPSLATFFRGEGYAARSIHPFSGWFWNRNEVYKAFGFEEFRTEETMPPMEKRGLFASDDSLMKEIMREGDAMERPFFIFAVTLQGHGPYEPHRYTENTVDIKGDLSDADRDTLATYTQGVREADQSLKMLMDWASKRDRETIIVLWGDHLPPLGTVYPDTSYMPEQVASRKAPLDVMKLEHETPLVIWSSRKGVRRDVGTISPSQLPYHILKTAGYEHPFYTGFLGRLQKKYTIIDRYQLATRDNQAFPDWARKEQNLDPLIRDYRYLQHDVMFGREYGLDRFFPSHAWLVSQGS